MKKVAVIGATGFVGAHIVTELADRGYAVEALVRDASKVKTQQNVTAKSVDVNNVEELAEALKGNDAVISAFNAGWTNPNLYNDFLKGSENIEKAVEESGIKRLIVVGGAEASIRQTMFRSLIHRISRMLTNQEQLQQEIT